MTRLRFKNRCYDFRVGNQISKVEKLGLAERVTRIMTDEGITVGREIGRKLRADGVSISDAAVNRYLKKAGRVAASRAEKIITEHVDKVIPDDLKALEELEGLGLKWTREEPLELADRLAGIKATIAFELDEWSAQIAAAAGESNLEKRAAAIKAIINKCLGYILKDDRLQDKRLRAAATVIKIIELKLSKAGLLKDEGRGRILIVDRSGEYDPEDAQKPAAERGRKCMVVRFDKPPGTKPEAPPNAR